MTVFVCQVWPADESEAFPDVLPPYRSSDAAEAAGLGYAAGAELSATMLEVSVLLPSPDKLDRLVVGTHVVQQNSLDMDFPLVYGPFADENSARCFSEDRRARMLCDRTIEDALRLMDEDDAERLFRMTRIRLAPPAVELGPVDY